ncbi:peptidoglycan bridge formation glycyltransferase FemA/FemB family protein [Deltaproteobacteria bacterium IMCC39524]|nr:peptidoglycan bridge formation glycyltransferase FemA/FemB family protein [Deltaproteobacteria bacterium IMCC39524]
MSYKVLNPLNIENWDSLISCHQDATFFHSQSWAKLLSDTYGYEPRYFSIFAEDKLCFLLPIMEIKSLFTGRRGVSLPFTDYVRPIVSRPEELQQLWQELIEHAKKSHWQHIDLRGDVGDQAIGSVYDSFYQHDIRLMEDADQMFSQFSNNNRRNIKKAIREGVEIEIRHDMESVDEFYHLNSITRKRHGIPSQPYRFFENLYKYVISDGKGIIVTAKKRGEVVAGSIYFLFGKSAIYKYGASKKEEGYLRANNLVMWEAIKWLSKRNYTSLSLGRTEKNNAGLVRYKNGWAPEQKSISYYRYKIKDNKFVVKEKGPGSLSTGFFKAAPVTVSNFLGGVLYRHVG